MTIARMIVDMSFAIGEIDRRLFGTFVEHIGRCVDRHRVDRSRPTLRTCNPPARPASD